MSTPDLASISTWMSTLQDKLVKEFEELDSEHKFERPTKDDAAQSNGTRTIILEGGNALEKASIVFSTTQPPIDATSKATPSIVPESGHAALTVSIHPRNPYAPVLLATLRAKKQTTPTPKWSFDGCLELSPCFGFDEDALHWHQSLYDALAPQGAHLYPAFKKACDERFSLPHRNEQRGIGGIVFDDYAEGTLEEALAMFKSVGECILPAYLPLLRRRCVYPSGERERTFQQLRRGRYVEYQLRCDPWMAHAFGGGILFDHAICTLPPSAHWSIGYQVPDDSWEKHLHERHLVARDWLHEPGKSETPTSPIWPIPGKKEADPDKPKGDK